MFRLFRGRQDTYGVQRIQGDKVTYYRVAKEMTPDDFEKHLSDQETLGLYPLLPSGEYCFFAAIDVDLPDLAVAQQIQASLPRPNYLERSRSGNFHIWMFFKEPASVGILAKQCEAAIGQVRRHGVHCNLYPLPAKGLGLLIALPLQSKLVGEDRTVFLEDGKVVKDHAQFFRELKFTRLKAGVLDDAKIKALYNGQGKVGGDCSRSGYDYSLCQALFKRGLPREEVKRILLGRPDAHSKVESYIEKTLDSAAGCKKPVTTSWNDIEVLTREQFFDAMRERLVLGGAQIQHLDIFFASLVANLRTVGRPIWLMIVGPPGCGKTLPMIALQHAPDIYAVSAFKPTALISGWGMKGGTDMSLIPKLDGKILLVKDMSSLLSQNRDVVSEILGLLRDAYDGACSRVFGTGVERKYKTRFGFVGATTPDIDMHWGLNVRLGERFLRYRYHSTDLEQVYSKIDKSLESLTAEDKVDEAIERSCLGYLKGLQEGNTYPKLSSLKQIGRLAQLGAILRTTVARGYRSQEILALPEWEEATRYAKQLAKMALALAYVRGKETNDEQEMEDLKKLVRDGIDARVERICEVVYQRPNMNTAEIASRVNLPAWTVKMCLDDLVVARVILQHRDGFVTTWSFPPWLSGQIKHFKLWSKGD